MKNLFSINQRHTVTEANINFYANPFVHPKRKMKDYDFIYMLQGEWKIGQNGEEFELKNDSLLILSANTVHYGVSPCIANTKTMYFHIFCEEIDENEESFFIDSLTDASYNKNIKKFFLETVNCKISGNQKKADAYFNLLLCELSENKLNSATTAIAQRIKNIIHQNPEKFFSNAEIAQMLNISVKTAETKFKAMFDTTIHQYMLNFKIEEAKSYFTIFPQMNIKEIAYNLGFYDEYHFSRQFKNITGLSPCIYKKSQS